MKAKQFIKLAIFVCPFLFAAISCSKSSGSGSSSPTVPTTADIGIAGMAFSPASKTVAKGTVVKWTNNDATPHTVTSNDGITFNSGSISGSSSYSYTANTAGTFNYHCTIHGVGMAGTLIVNP